MERIRKKLETIKAYRKQKKERREAILEKRRNSAFAKKMQPIYMWMNRVSIPLQVLLSFVLNFVIEAMSRHSIVEAWKYMVNTPWTFLYNMYIIFITFLPVYLVRHRMFSRIIVSFVWFAIGAVNGVVLSKRVTPFSAQDLAVISDFFTMIDKYFSGWQGIMWIVLIVSVVTWIVFMWRWVGQYSGKIYRIPAIIAIVVTFSTVGLVTKFAIRQNVLSNYFGNVAFAYEDYGVPYCFATSIFNTGISEPSNYNEKAIAKITGNGAYTKVSTTADELPNIVVIQLESFFDVNEVEFFETSKDPIPTFHYLMENYSSGYCKVPAIGAGTANTEFELLTGMSMHYFGLGEYPYKTVARYDAMESAATALKALGYGAHALHNNNGSFYNRDDVFANMGFDSFTSSEFMNVLKFTENGWAADEILTEHILNAMDSTKQQDFVFCITVEGHGDYKKDIENPIIEVTGIEEEDTKTAWEYYVNHLYATDQFVATLLKEFEKRNEPTVVVLYGDHLPALGLEASDLTSRYLYNTNYVIWDNIGLEKVDETLTTYQLMAETFKQIGIHSGTVFNYHQNRRQTKNYIADLGMLQYDMLYGERYVYGGIDNAPKRNENFQMGILDVTLSGIEKEDKSYVLHGTNMTSSSKVYVNGTKQKTIFYSDARIEFSGVTLKDGDVITVSQVSASNTPFRTSEEYVYSQGTLHPVSE